MRAPWPILEAALGKAVTGDPQLLRAYDHDLGEMPRALLSRLRTRPDAVVVARSPADVVSTLQVAARLGVPVTPRGQGSSGYGGSMPTRAGILLDLSALTKVLAVDEAAATVDVEPGVVWNELSRTLRKRGLDVRTLPTSAPSSTVGGWFASGGVGIGSLRYGSIRDAVLEIDVAGLDGRVATVVGQDLDLHHQTAGILGVITRLRLACRPAEEPRSFAVRLPEAEAVPALQAAAERDLGAYSLSIQSAGYLAMRARLDRGAGPPIAAGFLGLLTVSSPGDPAAVERAVAACGGALLDDSVAAHEWEDRFYPMRVKRLGPSLLVSEFLLPTERFPETWRAISRALRREELGLEAFAARGGRMAVLVYALEDAGHWLYPVRMARALAPVRIALRRGGSVYTPGLWFAWGARSVLGEARYEAVVAEKRRVDPAGLLNPDKVLGPRLRGLPLVDASRLLALSAAFASPLSRWLAPRPVR
ncbi:MAG TPA: FAD-binding oxidoreductase [Anaeromyxobacter sp.]|nr:FAD-binding oxidoreductase [Anaeromyxobacter sp.]